MAPVCEGSQASKANHRGFFWSTRERPNLLTLCSLANTLPIAKSVKPVH